MLCVFIWSCINLNRFFIPVLGFFPERKLNLFTIFTRNIGKKSFPVEVSVGVIPCNVISLHYFVGDRNSVGSVGSSRSTGSGQSSESTHNKHNESHLRTDMYKVCAFDFENHLEMTSLSIANESVTFFKQMAPSAGELSEQLHKMTGDDGKMGDGTMGNPNFCNLRYLRFPCCYLLCCLRYPPRVRHQVIKAQIYHEK